MSQQGPVWNAVTREWETPWPVMCGNGCGAELPDSGYKVRRVPSKGGRKLRVCAPCAEAIDAQETLAVDAPPAKSAAPHVRLAAHRPPERGGHVCRECGAEFEWPGLLDAHFDKTGHAAGAAA